MRPFLKSRYIITTRSVCLALEYSTLGHRIANFLVIPWVDFRQRSALHLLPTLCLRILEKKTSV